MPLARYKNLASAKKQSILHSAEREFSEHGFDRASLNRLVSNAGFSKGSFYYYFEDKGDLFVTVLEAHFPSRVWLDQSGLLTAGGSSAFWAAFRSYLMTQYEHIGHHPRSAHLLSALDGLSEAHFATTSLHAHRARTVAEMTEVVERGRQVDAVRSDLPLTLLTDMWNGLQRSFTEWLLKDWAVLSRDEQDDRIEIATRLIRDVLEEKP